MRSFTMFLGVLVAAWGISSGCSRSETSSGEVAEEVVVTVEAVCDDGVDEDGDGDTDCDDADCAASELCAIETCKTVCAAIFECDGIVEACTEKELVGVLKGCQASCSDESVRSQVSMADGVPCFVIGGVFLDQVQSQGICLGDRGGGEEGADASNDAGA